MAVTDFFVGESATELLKQLFFLSMKACRYKGTAENLIALIEGSQPTIKEIQFGGVELPTHRQAQIRMLSETLEKGRKLTENCLSSRRWNVGRQLYLAKKMERLEKTIVAFFTGPILTNILADVHLLRANSDVRLDRVDRNLEIMCEKLASMKIGVGGMITDALNLAEAMEIETTDDLEKFGDDQVQCKYSSLSGCESSTSRRDDNFLGEANSLSTVVKLPCFEKWKEALDLVSQSFASVFHYPSDDERVIINNIVEQVKRVTTQIAYMTTPLTGELGVIDRVVENVPKVLEFTSADRTEIPRDKFTEFSINPENMCREICSNSPMDGKVKPPHIQVFINFRGDQLRNNFVGYLVAALRGSGINVFIDHHEQRGEDLNTLFKRIEDSGIAIVLFSSRYTESKWCLDELVKIKERVHQGLLKVLPIFYKVTPTNVKRLKGDFGDHFRDKEYMYGSEEPRIKRWKEAIVFVSHRFALVYDEKSSVVELDFVATIVGEVLKMLQAISTVESGQSSR